MLWDTAGQEEFDSITRTYYRGAGACVLAFSTTDRDSFAAIKDWKRKVDDECPDIPYCLIQNKIDLLEVGDVSLAEGESLASELDIPFYKTCVKDNVNVAEVFKLLTSKFIEKRDSDRTAQVGAMEIGEMKRSKVAKNSKDESIEGSSSSSNGNNRRVDKGEKNKNSSSSSSSSSSKAAVKAPGVYQVGRADKQRTGGKKKFSCTML
jgi:Ras-related protein Rab-23